MYRVNYRKYHGVVFGNQKLYQQGSFISSLPHKVGAKVFRPEVCDEVEVMQIVETSNF